MDKHGGQVEFRAQILALLLFPHVLCLEVLFAKVFRLINVIESER